MLLYSCILTGKLETSTSLSANQYISRLYFSALCRNPQNLKIWHKIDEHFNERCYIFFIIYIQWSKWNNFFLLMSRTTIILMILSYCYNSVFSQVPLLHCYTFSVSVLLNINSSRHKSLTSRNPTWPLHCCEPEADRSEVWSLTQALGELAAIRHNIDLLLHSWEGPEHFSHFVSPRLHRHTRSWGFSHRA